MPSSQRKESSAFKKATLRAQEELKGFDKAFSVLKELRAEREKQLTEEGQIGRKAAES